MFTTLTQLGTALTKNADVAFGKGMKQSPMAGRMMFNVKTVKNKISESDTYAFDPLARKTGEGGVYASADPVKGYNLILTQAKFTQSFEQTKESGMYDKYNVVETLRGVEGLGTACGTRFELDLQLLIGNATSANYTDIDGNVISTQNANSENIAANTHTVRSGATYDNLDASAFGQTGIEADEDLWRAFVNHDGGQTDHISTHIYSTRKSNLRNLVDEYLNSKGHVEDQNRGLNVFNKNFSRTGSTPRYGYIIMEYLDATSTRGIDTAKDDYWGTVRAGAESLQAEVSQNPVVYAPQLVQRTRNVLIQTDTHYAYGVRDSFDITQHNA